MSKQHTQSQGIHRESPENNQNADQSQDRQDRVRNPADREYEEEAQEGGGEEEVQEGGGEESKHGRKQKGNVDDT